MRILYSHRTLSGEGQGVHIAAVLAALRAAGHAVEEVGPPRPTAARRSTPAPAPRQQNRLPFGLYEVAEWGYSVPAAHRLRRVTKRFSPDILYERYNLHHHAGRWTARGLGLPLLLEVNAPMAEERAEHGQLVHRAWAKRSEAAIWRSADAVLPVSEVLAAHCRAAGVRDEAIHVIPNAVAEDHLRPRDGAAIRERYGLGDGLIVGFLGFVRSWHGVDLAVDWLATSPGQAATLLVVGDGPAVPALRQRAAELGVAARVVVTGEVSEAEVPGHVAAMDIALQPAVTAYASPLKLQEYMAQARAVLAPDLPNIAETVSDGASALLFKDGDQAAFAAGLDRLAQDPEMRVRLGSSARAALIAQGRTWPQVAARITSIAEGLIAARARRTLS